MGVEKGRTGTGGGPREDRKSEGGHQKIVAHTDNSPGLPHLLSSLLFPPP